jgi:hypothetical protein
MREYVKDRIKELGIRSKNKNNKDIHRKMYAFKRDTNLEVT